MVYNIFSEFLCDEVSNFGDDDFLPQENQMIYDDVIWAKDICKFRRIGISRPKSYVMFGLFWTVKRLNTHTCINTQSVICD